MIIEAISGVKNSSFNNINFEARKNKKGSPVSNPTVSSTVKAVPLAVLLAMSPMTTTNAENIMRGEANTNAIELVNAQSSSRVVESKIFEKDFTNYTVSVEKTSQADNPYKIRVEAKSTEDMFNKFYYDGYVTGFNKVNYGVYDDSGRKVSQFNYKHAVLSDVNNEYVPESVTDEDVCKYVEQLMAKYNTGVKPQNQNFALKMTTYGDLIHTKPSTNWLQETEVAYSGKYGKIINTGDVETEDGPYRVYLNSTDGDDKSFEAVSIVNKDGTIRHRVSGVIACSAEIHPSLGDKVTDLELHQINIIDPNGRQRVICNKELWNVLIRLSNVAEFNDAYYLKDVKRVHRYTNNTDGKLSASEKALEL